MYAKPELIFEMIKTAGQLYELRHGGPNKLILVMGWFNDSADPSKEWAVAIEECPDSAATMAKALLEHVYNGANRPSWISPPEA